MCGETQKISMPGAARKVTLSNIKESQLKDPRFGIYKVEAGRHEGDYVVADSDGNMVVLDRKKYNKERPFAVVKENGFYVLEDQESGKVWLTQSEWEMLNMTSRGSKRKRQAAVHN
ncbi:MAG: hypothetical protein Q7S53_04010 [bacterium]|nr:hypothetical protein [bacterium]